MEIKLNNLEEILKGNNIELETLAEHSKVSMNTLKKIISKRRAVSPQTEEKIIVALNRLLDRNFYGYEIFRKGEKKLIEELRDKDQELEKTTQQLLEVNDQRKDIEKNLLKKGIENDRLQEKIDFYDLTNTESFFIKIPESLRTGLQQYFVYFKDYVRNFKGKDIKFEVIRVKGGLRIDIRYGEIDKKELDKWFKDFLKNLRQPTKIIDSTFEVHRNENEKSIIKKELQNQVVSFENTLKILQERNNLLEKEVSFLRKLSIKLTESNITKSFDSASKNELKKKLSEGKIKEIINSLLKVTDNDEKLYDNLISILFQYNNTINDSLKGIISNEEKTRALNIISQSILEIINRI